MKYILIALILFTTLSFAQDPPPNYDPYGAEIVRELREIREVLDKILEEMAYMNRYECYSTEVKIN